MLADSNRLSRLCEVVPMASLSAGSVVANRFEIEQIAGRGGMGTVYRARDRERDQVVALKLLRSDSPRPDKTERFAREAQLLSELSHPGIVSYVAHGQDLDGQYYLAMEWLDGEDLASRLARGPLPLRECVLLLERISEALAVTHQHGVIHRDLKPNNIFLVGNRIDQAKLLDFGIARRLGVSRPLTRIGRLIGTPEYMAPEQVRGSPTLTPATDLFALGCVLYECLAGTPPFVAEHITAVLVRILFEDPLPVESWRPHVPAPLLRLLQSLLAKDPAQRLADAVVLRTELSALGELPESEPAATSNSLSAGAPHAAFGEGEQSLFSIVLAALPVQVSEPEATLTDSGSLVAPADRQTLVQSLLALGTRPDFLADGSLVVTVPLLDSAQDQVVLAARAALCIKSHRTEAAVTMATGRGTIQGYTAVGEVVEHAARRLRLGIERSPGLSLGGVLVDALSAKLLEGRYVLVPQQEGALLIAEEREADTSRLLLGKPTPCVGRESELAMLEAQLASSSDDSEARAVLITAPPGVGKSRLRHEFLRRVNARSKPPIVLLGRGDMMSAGAPYGILAQAIRRLCALDDSSLPAKQQAQLAARIGAILPAAIRTRVVEFIGELCLVPFPGDNERLTAARQDPLLLHAQISRAFLDWLSALAQESPVLLVFDDLQWGDSLSTGLLDAALRELRGAPLLILALGRPEVRDLFPKLWTRHKLLDHALKGLSKKASERLARQFLGADVSADAVGRLIEQSAGNALFLEELIRATANNEPVEQPDTVVAMLQARIGRSAPWARRILEAASIFGQTFWRGGVLSLLRRDGDSQSLDSALDALLQTELIERHHRSRFPSEVEYGFRHALVRDAAFALLSPADQELGNRLACTYLEQAGERDPMVLAEHAYAGRDLERAIVFYQRAAKESYDRYDLAAMVHRADRSIACGARGATLGQLLALKLEACARRLDLQTARKIYEEAMPLLQPGSRWWSKTLGVLVSLASQMANLPLMNEITEELLRHAPAQDALVPYCEAAANVLASSSLTGLRERALLFFNRLQGIDPALIAHEALARGHLQFGMFVYYVYLEYGPYPAYEHARQSLAAFEQAQALRLRNMALLAESAALGALGQYDLAEHTLRTSLADALAMDDVLTIVGARLQLMLLLAERPNPKQLAEAAEIAELMIETTPAEAVVGSAQGVLARVLMTQGRLSEAAEAAEQALATLLTTRTPRPQILRTLIEIRLRQGRIADAQKVVEEVQEYLKIHGGAGNAEALLRVAVVEAQLSAGNLAAARASLDVALGLISRCAEQIPDPVMRERYRTELRENVRLQELAKLVPTTRNDAGVTPA